MIKTNNEFVKTIGKSFNTLNTIATNSKLVDGAEVARLGILALYRFPNESTRAISEFCGLPVPGIQS